MESVCLEWLPPVSFSAVFLSCEDTMETVLSLTYTLYSVCGVAGLLGVIWFILWMTFVSSSPEKNHRITEAERLMISKCLDSLDMQVIVVQLLWMHK